MIAMKLCSAQLRHQSRLLTARPHAAGATHTCTQKGPQKKAWNVFTQVPSVCQAVGFQTVYSGSKQTSQFTKSSAFTMTSALRCQWPLCLRFSSILITSVISPMSFSSARVALLASQPSCFLSLSIHSLISPTGLLIPFIQLWGGISRRVSTTYMDAPYVNERSGKTIARHGNRRILKIEVAMTPCCLTDRWKRSTPGNIQDLLIFNIVTISPCECA